MWQRYKASVDTQECCLWWKHPDGRFARWMPDQTVEILSSLGEITSMSMRPFKLGDVLSYLNYTWG